MVRTVHHMANCVRCVGIYNVLSASVCRYVGIQYWSDESRDLLIYWRSNACTVQQRHGSLFNCEKGQSVRCPISSSSCSSIMIFL